MNLKEELAAMLREGGMYIEHDIDKHAERLASAFQHVGWWDESNQLLPNPFSPLGGMYRVGSPPVYVFAGQVARGDLGGTR